MYVSIFIYIYVCVCLCMWLYVRVCSDVEQFKGELYTILYRIPYTVKNSSFIHEQIYECIIVLHYTIAMH